ncbi:MAG: hypothetical protein COS92_02485 [Desulfobacterales bacterium CG07_land_8_20_14_0_80_52_14]|nr:MAG: hypothetical protein COX20_10920 [Desulfobacterales bacterium CG23_combo_of_CG06-09_8_20_14_all_52_9]PIU50232.1 MAG: hypothetical protein COS92_02485 [Desulfobacterales bacterium CG07_land_8_20_14_0_80_52_14]
MGWSRVPLKTDRNKPIVSKKEISRIRAIGRIEGYLSDIRRLEKSLGQAPLWTPGASLIRECREAFHLITSLKERFERKLVITLIGASGSGKSTLFNALSGVDDLSETGFKRPTTRKIILLSQAGTDAEDLIRELGSEHVEIRHIPETSFLENAVLIDTPDTDSTLLEEHRILIHKAIAFSDVLICLFDAQNPKRKDHTDFLASYVHRFDGESLIAVLNKCDRLKKEELITTIVPEFLGYIQDSWGKPAEALYCISGRNHLKNPGWDPSASPLHEFDQFDALKEKILLESAYEGALFDCRLKNAQEILDYLFMQVKTEASKDRETLSHALNQIRDLEKKAADSAMAVLQSNDSPSLFSLSTRIYQELVQRWTGPVGWLIALWYRLLAFGSGIASLFRLPRSVRHMRDQIASFRRQVGIEVKPFSATGGESNGLALKEYRLVIVRHWGDIAAALIKGRFDPSTRQIDTLIQGREALEDHLSSVWNTALAEEVRETADRLSGFFIQLLFNLPILGISGYAAWLTIRDFIQGKILPFDFFLHAFFAIGVTFFLSFFAFQVWVRFFAKKRRIEARALQATHRTTDPDGWLGESAIAGQVATVLTFTQSV